jgi:glucosamine-6-phosphate deaminase
MQVKILKNAQKLGQAAAEYSAKIMKDKIAQKGCARIVMSTGASQFDTIKALVEQNVDWSKVTMFHLDEYVDLPETHPASFRRYLKERFISKVDLKAYHLVTGEGDIQDTINELTKELRRDTIDLGLIGIGENAHIAFNDPPADFDTEEAYIVVDLDEKCKKQQVGEGWFGSVEDVPKQAISMTVHQIMECENIVSCVPNKIKAPAVKKTLDNKVTNLIPATILKEHKSFTLFLDENSAALIDKSKYDG